MNVVSSGGVALAVHDLGGAGPTVLVSHATGFHGRCYLPLARHLPGRHLVAFDYRGHGDTPHPDAPVDWQRYADDAEAMAGRLVDEQGSPIDAFGHSMGGACLLIVALRRPELFRRIVAYEPIVFPPPLRDADHAGNVMSEGARRRRANFPSYEAAIENYSSKPPLRGFTPEALDSYVRHGFRQGPDGTVHLKCTNHIESETFAMGAVHDTWDHLPGIETEVVVVCGRMEPFQPSSLAAGIAERLPHGRLVQRDDLDHFGPMTHPDEVARLLDEAFG